MDSAMSAHADVDSTILCPHCPQLFRDESLLDQHLLMHTDDQDEECPTCGKVYRRYYLNQHMISHSEENPYKCDFCDYVTKWKSNLKQHLLVHTNEKPFKCSVCDYSCKRKYDLKSHQLAVHKDEQLVSENCSKSYPPNSIDDHACDPDSVESLFLIPNENLLAGSN